MPYSLSYFKDSIQDIKDAKAWYRDKQPGLEKRFSEAIKSAIQQLQENPLVHGVRYQNIRIAHPKVFPYGIHFYIDEGNQLIVIVAIVHNKRHPDIVKKRL